MVNRYYARIDKVVCVEKELYALSNVITVHLADFLITDCLEASESLQRTSYDKQRRPQAPMLDTN